MSGYDVGIKVGIDTSEAKMGLDSLRKELVAIANFNPKTDFSFLESIKTALNSIKNTLNSLKDAFAQGFDVIEKSADGTVTAIKEIQLGLEKTSKSAKDVERSATSMGSALTKAANSANASADKTATKVQRAASKINEMVGIINRLSTSELKFAKSPFDTGSKFYEVNKQLMDTSVKLKNADVDAKLLVKTFQSLQNTSGFNGIYKSLTQLNERVIHVNNIIKTLKQSTVSLDNIGLVPKGLGEWGKVNGEMLKSEKIEDGLKQKLLSLNEINFNNVLNSVKVFDYAIKNNLVDSLVKANEELTRFNNRKATLSRVGIMSSSDLQNVKGMSNAIRDLSSQYEKGKISTKEYASSIKDIGMSMSSQSFSRMANGVQNYDARMKEVNTTLEKFKQLSTTIVTPEFSTKMVPEVRLLINELKNGTLSADQLWNKLISLNNTSFSKISTNVKNISREIKKAQEQFYNSNSFQNMYNANLRGMALSPYAKDLGQVTAYDEKLRQVNVALEQFNELTSRISGNTNFTAKLTPEIEKMVNEFRNGTKSVEQLRKELLALNNQSLQKISTSVANVNKQLKREEIANNKSLQNLYGANLRSMALSPYAKELGQMSTEMNKATKESNQLAKASNNAGKAIDRAGKNAGGAKRQINALDRASNLLRRTLSGLAVMFGWNLAMDLIEVGKNSADAANQIQMVGNSMHWSEGQVSAFTSRMRDLQSVYPKIDMSQTAKSVMEMARNYNLTNSEATKLIKTSAIFTSAMAKEGRTTEDANLALKDYLDGGSGWTRRMSEIGATRERLKDTGKWSGDENDINGKIAALDALMAQKGYNEFAKNIYTLDDAFNAFKYTLGSVIGELAQGLTPSIIALTKWVISAISGVKGLIQAFQASSFGNQALQIIAVAGAFSGLAMVILKVIGTLWGLIQAKTLLTTLTNPIGVIVIAVSALAIAFYELGKSVGWWHDFNSMMEALGNNITTIQGKITLIGTTIGTIAGIALAKHFLSDSNIIVRAIDKVIDSIRKYIQALAAKKVAEEADEAATAGKKGTEVAGTAAAGAAEAGKVAAEGKKVSTVSRIFGALGIEYTADAGFVSMFNASGTALAGALGAAIPVIVVLTAVIGLVIAAVFGLAAECTLLLKGLQLVINAMHFENINLQPAVNGLKQLSAALWEILVAMTELSLIGTLHLITGDIIGVAYQLWALGGELAKLKSAVPMINSFSSAQKINPKVVENLTSLSKGLVAMNNASKNLGDIGSQEGWKKFWEWLRVKMPDSEALAEVHSNLSDAIPKINSFGDLPGVSDQAVQKITKASEAITKLDSAMKGLEGLGKHAGGGGKFAQGGNAMPQVDTIDYYAEVIDSVKDTMWKVADKLAKLKDMPAIPEGTGNKIQRVTWVLNDVAQSFDALAKIPPTNDDDIVGILSGWNDKVDSVKIVLWKVAGHLRTLHDMPAIPEGTGGKIQRVTWVLNDVKSAINALKGAISGMGGNDDYSSKVSQLSTLTGSIHKIAVPLRNLSTIANIPDGISNKLNRVKWALNDAKGVRNSINSYGSVGVDANAVSNISKVTGATHKIAVPLRNLSTIANIPPTVSVKLAGVNRTLASLKGTANNIKGANASMTGLPPYQAFAIKLGNLKKIIEKLRDFKVTGNTKGNNLSGISAMVKNISTQVNACVTAVNRAVSSLGSAGRRLGSALKNGVSAGVSGTGQLVVDQISIMNGAMDSARGKSDQLGGAFSNLHRTVYTLTQGINNLKDAINNLPSNKSITIGITANTTTKGSLPAGVSMDSIDSKDWGTITGYTGGTASTGGHGLFAGLFGSLRSGIHSGVKGLSGGLDRMSVFESLAEGVIGNTSYEYYYNSKNGGDVSDSLQSGSFNCYDGSLVLMSLASLLGLDSELKGTTVGGEGHAYTKIGGKVFDSTAMQLFGRRTAPNVHYSGVSGTDNSKQKQDKPVNVTVNVNGDIYGEKDLKDKIKEGAEQVMIDLLSPSKATGR